MSKNRFMIRDNLGQFWWFEGEAIGNKGEITKQAIIRTSDDRFWFFGGTAEDLSLVLADGIPHGGPFGTAEEAEADFQVKQS